MKITRTKLILLPALFASALWQPGHHFLMHHGMAMNSGVHFSITIVPILSILFALSKAKWNY